MRKAYNRRLELGDLVHFEHRTMRRAYGALIEDTKRAHLEGFLASLDERSVWTAHRYTSGEPSDGGRARIPSLRGGQVSRWSGVEQVAETNEDKSSLLCTTFFPELERDDTSHTDADYLAPKFKFRPVTNEKIHRVIARLGPFKAPGLDSIPNVLLIRCTDLLVPNLGPLYRATFKLDAYPAGWRDSVMVVLKKPGKADYTVPNAHRPVALLNTIAKVLSACMAEDLNHAIETYGLLPKNHFRSRPRTNNH